MPYETVAEPVEVLVAFHTDRPEPMAFKWANRYYQVHKVNLIHMERIGQEKVYYFSVSDEANIYRLSFRTGSLAWRLEEKAALV